MKNYRAVCAGTYDPPHFGHLVVWRTAAEIFGAKQVQVLVASNLGKVSMFSPHERAELVAKTLDEGNVGLHVDVLHETALTVDVALERGASFLVRGVRGPRDFEDEAALADINARLRPGYSLQTILIPCGESLHTISSTLIRQLGMMKPVGWREFMRQFTSSAVVEAFAARKRHL